MQPPGFTTGPSGSARDAAVELSPCPFCGGEAALRRHPEIHEVVRVECVGPECEIHPRTEYLLEEYAGELAAAWNRRRMPRGAGARPFRRPAGRAVS